VRVGDVVRIRDSGLDEWWRIVPQHEADALRHWISECTPLACALVGHHAGDVVSLRLQRWRRQPVLSPARAPQPQGRGASLLPPLH
jgi:transcription elongation GreA/GreB family factor